MQYTLDDPEEKVCVDVPLVHLIHHDDAVAGEGRISLNLSQEQALCQKEDSSSRSARLFESYLEANIESAGCYA